MISVSNHREVLERLSDEDLAFIIRFVMASGSLKELAASYEVSYPTIRLRLDRLIQKVEVLSSTEEMSNFQRLLQAYFAEGKIDKATFHSLQKAHAEEQATERGSE